MKWFKCVLLAVALGFAACGDDSSGPNLETCQPETGAVTATVTAGQSVVFDWEPECAVAMLLVEEDGSDMWAISTDEETWTDPGSANLIHPPVTYGALPAGATETEEPLLLVAGTPYELVLWRILPEGSAAQCRQRFENACLLTVHAFTR